jgi:hypothetical protein
MTAQNELKPTDGGIAVGAYLRFLREAQGLAATVVAEKTGTNQSQIWRIDNWRHDVRGTLIFAYIRAVNGDANDVALLISNPKATISDGETLAKLRLAIIKS